MNILKRLKSPTPKLWRQIGNALLIISTTITGYTAYVDEPIIATISMICGILGKIITSFFVEDNTEV
jgi:hypothetical protein